MENNDFLDDSIIQIIENYWFVALTALHWHLTKCHRNNETQFSQNQYENIATPRTYSSNRLSENIYENAVLQSQNENRFALNTSTSSMKPWSKLEHRVTTKFIIFKVHQNTDLFRFTYDILSFVRRRTFLPHRFHPLSRLACYLIRSLVRSFAGSLVRSHH